MVQHFGQRIRRAREACQVTQTALAERMGITRPALSQIESGLSDVYAHRVRDVARILEVDGNYLLGLSDQIFTAKN